MRTTRKQTAEESIRTNGHPKPTGMKVRTSIKAGPGGYSEGGILINHDQSSARLKVRTSVKAGGNAIQHNRTSARPRRPR